MIHQLQDYPREVIDEIEAQAGQAADRWAESNS